MSYHNHSFKLRIKSVLCVTIGGLLLLISCRKDVRIPDKYGISNDFDITFNVPEGWPSPYYSFKNNTLTKTGFILGRKLFYETRLSKDNSTSCGSCHQNFAAFANADHSLSHGVYGLLGTRNSPPLFNLNWHTSFMWDGGVNHIEVQPLAPIENPVEMDETLNSIIAKLEADDTYKRMFSDAFGSTLINSERIFKALAQFMGAMVSANAKYDRYMRKNPSANFSAEELAGLAVFENKCAACHKAPLFTDFSFRNKGLRPGAVNDSGRAHITSKAEDLYKFKVPSLRNLKYTAPYMHDGRYASIDQVLDQMSEDVFESPTLDPLMKDGISLSDQEKSDLKAFLNTLNDESFVSDKRFAEQQ